MVYKFPADKGAFSVGKVYIGMFCLDPFKDLSGLWERQDTQNMLPRRSCVTHGLAARVSLHKSISISIGSFGMYISYHTAQMA